LSRPFQYLEQSPEPDGTALGVGVSLSLHVAALVLVFLGVTQKDVAPPEKPLQYVELVPRMAPQQAAPGAPRVFTEAPGRALEQPPAASDAALSDANRRAATPNPTGDALTRRPGDGSGGAYIPSSPPPGQTAPASRPSGTENPETPSADRSDDSGLQYRAMREGTPQVADATPQVDWRAAVKDIGRSTTIAGQPGRAGGEAGFAESGPISFETQWYDWGPYSAQMVARIRLHWYNNMPDIIRTGMKGVVVIRFTIQRNGRITDVTLLQSSGIPPYDFAAQKAIELASPLAPLPPDFPEPSERVTAAFYYNQNPPTR
jgi:TonB family protein